MNDVWLSELLDDSLAAPALFEAVVARDDDDDDEGEDPDDVDDEDKADELDEDETDVLTGESLKVVVVALAVDESCKGGGGGGGVASTTLTSMAVAVSVDSLSVVPADFLDAADDLVDAGTVPFSTSPSVPILSCLVLFIQLA